LSLVLSLLMLAAFAIWLIIRRVTKRVSAKRRMTNA
jgi:hypothetical protein